MKKIRLARHSGFSLIEVLVAFAILALALGVLMRIFGGGVKMAAISEDYSRAVILAQSNLAAVGIEEALDEGVLRGDADEKFYWTLSVTPFQVDEDEEIDLDRIPVKPYLVESRVEWGSEERTRSIVLNTLRLAPVNDIGLNSNNPFERASDTEFEGSGSGQINNPFTSGR